MPEAAEHKYVAQDKRIGFPPWQVKAIIDTHSPVAIMRVTVGWRGQIQTITMIEPPVESPLPSGTKAEIPK